MGEVPLYGGELEDGRKEGRGVRLRLSQKWKVLAQNCRLSKVFRSFSLPASLHTALAHAAF